MMQVVVVNDGKRRELPRRWWFVVMFGQKLVLLCLWPVNRAIGRGR